MPVIREYLTPASGLNSKVVTTGPGWIATTSPSIANSWSFSVIRSARSSNVCLLSVSWSCGSLSRLSGGSS